MRRFVSLLGVLSLSSHLIGSFGEDSNLEIEIESDEIIDKNKKYVWISNQNDLVYAAPLKTMNDGDFIYASFDLNDLVIPESIGESICKQWHEKGVLVRDLSRNGKASKEFSTFMCQRSTHCCSAYKDLSLKSEVCSPIGAETDCNSAHKCHWGLCEGSCQRLSTESANKMLDALIDPLTGELSKTVKKIKNCHQFLNDHACTLSHRKYSCKWTKKTNQKSHEMDGLVENANGEFVGEIQVKMAQIQIEKDLLAHPPVAPLAPQAEGETDDTQKKEMRNIPVDPIIPVMPVAIPVQAGENMAAAPVVEEEISPPVVKEKVIENGDKPVEPEGIIIENVDINEMIQEDLTNDDNSFNDAEAEVGLRSDNAYFPDDDSMSAEIIEKEDESDAIHEDMISGKGPITDEIDKIVNGDGTGTPGGSVFWGSSGFWTIVAVAAGLIAICLVVSLYRCYGHRHVQPARFDHHSMEKEVEPLLTQRSNKRATIARRFSV